MRTKEKSLWILPLPSWKWHEAITPLKKWSAELNCGMSNASEPLSTKQKGAPAAYVANVATYVRMGANLRILEGMAKGEMAVYEGRVASHEEAKIRMAKWLD